MPHVTFIHGIANKPPADRLQDEWLRILTNAGLDLGAEGVTTGMVYWADVLHEAPEPMTAGAETAASAIGTDSAGEAGAPLGPTLSEAEFIAGLSAKVGGVLAARGNGQDSSDTDAGLERIPLPWSVKKRFLEAYLRDVHHYLFNVESTPREGETYHVQDIIRDRFVGALRQAPGSGPHVVVSHSMGTVIAYDCLKNLADCPTIDALITIGSPLGVDEVQDRLLPGWSRDDGFPANAGSWLNFSDRLDPVCGFDARIANDFLVGGKPAVVDTIVRNSGPWRHSISKYLGQDEVLSAIRQELGL